MWMETNSSIARSEIILDHFLAIIETDLWTHRLHTGCEYLKPPDSSSLFIWTAVTLGSCSAVKLGYLSLVEHLNSILSYFLETGLSKRKLLLSLTTIVQIRQEEMNRRASETLRLLFPPVFIAPNHIIWPTFSPQPVANKFWNIVPIFDMSMHKKVNLH